jgi:protein-tyrosine phosphatase
VLLRNANLSRDAVDGCYTQLYSELPFDPPYRDLFATAIRRFADSEGRVLVHCTAGKDRTGILVGLILHSLGVPRDAILTDYMLSSRAPGLLAMKPKIIAKARQRYGHALAEDGVEMLLDVKPAYLQTAFEAIVRECGSVEAYLDSAGAGPDVRAKLRERLLTY